jgi:2,3-bisphosphoglycerate-dependent phosphoglycerate mutase
MPKLVLLRHGESTWNAEGRFAGRVNVPLTDKGREQAKVGGQQISEINFDSVFTSTLIRAQETALIALSQSKSEKTPVLLNSTSTYQAQTHETPVYVDPGLDEVYCGDWEGGFKKVVAPERKWPYEIVEEYFPGGESFTTVTERIVQVYDSQVLPKLEQNQNVLIVGHGISLQGLIGHLENLNWDELKWVKIDNASPRVYEWDGDLRLLQADG